MVQILPALLIMKRLFIVHGWGGFPEEAWFPWLSKEATKTGFHVQSLAMPNTNTPKINEWIPFLAKSVGKLDSETYFLGHSIGCQAIIRYLASQNNNSGGVILVAPWFTLTGLESKEEEAVAEPWTNDPIDFAKVKKNAKKIIAIFSDNDPFVPLENVKMFEQKLNAKTIIEKNKGHFNLGDGVTTLPIALEELLSIVR